MNSSKFLPLIATLVVAGVMATATLAVRDGREADRARADRGARDVGGDARVRPGTADTDADAVLRPSHTLSPASVVELPPEEQDWNKAARISDLDRRLRAERFDPEWTREQEEIIARAIAGSEHDGLTVALPDRMDTTCRSTLCRITMTYADEEDAMRMHTKLALGLRGSISSALAFYRPGPNGGTELLVYAGKLD